MIVAMGTNDTLASSGAQLDYYQSIIDKMGRKKMYAFARLFVLPQANHGLMGSNYAVNGDGKSIPVEPLATRFDRFKLLVDWVEKGIAPPMAVTVTGEKRSLPMCSYPRYPKYNGGSILNIPASICYWLNIPEIGAGTLSPEILSPLGNGIQRVILILMDALALHRLQNWMENGSASIWQSLMQDGLLAPLTSITPSTTSAALTTLWTGQSPSAHGVMGYTMLLKEYGVVANMILHSPLTFQGDVGTLAKAGFDPEAFLPLPTLGPHLRQHGISQINIIRRTTGARWRTIRCASVTGMPCDSRTRPTCGVMSQHMTSGCGAKR